MYLCGFASVETYLIPVWHLEIGTAASPYTSGDFLISCLSENAFRPPPSIHVDQLVFQEHPKRL